MEFLYKRLTVPLPFLTYWSELLHTVSRVPASTSDQEDRQCDDIYEDLCALRRRSAFFKVAEWQMRQLLGMLHLR